MVKAATSLPVRLGECGSQGEAEVRLQIFGTPEPLDGRPSKDACARDRPHQRKISDDRSGPVFNTRRHVACYKYQNQPQIPYLFLVLSSDSGRLDSFGPINLLGTGRLQHNRLSAGRLQRFTRMERKFGA